MTSINGKADTVIKNANIITIDTGRPRAQALAMSHGRLAGVGSNEDIEGLIGPDTKVWTWAARPCCQGSSTPTSTC